MNSRKLLLALSIASASTAALGNYVGTLKPHASSLMPEKVFYSFASPVLLGLAPTLHADPGYRVKLGFQPSRYFLVQTEYVDYGKPGTNLFSSPAASVSSGFRSMGYGIDAVAVSPTWNRISVYGRLGAFRGEVRPAFSPYSTSLLEATRGTRMRYGLGLSYDFNRAFAIRAEYERYTPLGQFLPVEAETDLFSVGLKWRF